MSQKNAFKPAQSNYQAWSDSAYNFIRPELFTYVPAQNNLSPDPDEPSGLPLHWVQGIDGVVHMRGNMVADAEITAGTTILTIPMPNAIVIPRDQLCFAFIAPGGPTQCLPLRLEIVPGSDGQSFEVGTWDISVPINNTITFSCDLLPGPKAS